ncbi:hypothetical protein WJX72_007240 [[Myrmecia] bisecta]|uniref:WD repeat-containing protein 61 n=1 Tax=[Myrmecia] bisecta TaxID=41462 RepID=A0AAW1R8I9_9CHLO
MRLSLVNKLEDAHKDAIWSVTWATSNVLITGSVDESVKAWTEQGNTVVSAHEYTGHTLGVISVAVDSTATYAASSALDSYIRVWNLNDNSTKAVLETPPSETWQITFHPSSDPLLVAAAGGSSNMVTIYNADTSQKHATLLLPTGDEKFKKEKFVLSVAYSPDGRRLACGSMDGTVCIFDVAAGTLLHTLEGHYKPVRSLAFTPDSQMLVTGCDDMHSHLYDVENAFLIEAFSGHESWVLSVACHPDGSAFATGSSDSKVKLWDLQTRTCAQTLTEHTDQVWGVAFRSDGSRLASVSDDKSLAIYDFA